MSAERKYPLHAGGWFTNFDVEIAMDAHQRAGLILEWRRGPHAVGAQSGTREHPLYIATVFNGAEVHMATAWEAYAFVMALASARQALGRKTGDH